MTALPDRDIDQMLATAQPVDDQVVFVGTDDKIPFRDFMNELRTAFAELHAMRRHLEQRFTLSGTESLDTAADSIESFLRYEVIKSSLAGAEDADRGARLLIAAALIGKAYGLDGYAGPASQAHHVDELRERLGQSEWIVCSEALAWLDGDPAVREDHERRKALREPPTEGTE